ncbi:MAG: dihydrodipicolinate reductase [Zestosphaera sp.]
MGRPLRLVLYGIGPIGALVVRLASSRKGLELVGGVDVDPAKVGEDLGVAAGLGRSLGVKVVHDAQSWDLLKNVKPDFVVITTGTYLDRIYTQVVKSISVGANVVSTSETLAYPWYRYPELSLLIDELAKKNGVRVLGTGVNPGFVFDTVPAVLSSVSARVDRIHVVRSQDASKRRYSFQKKYGLSLTPEEFRVKVSSGEITAHVGYAESVMLLASMLGVCVDRVEEGQEPIIADKYMETQYFKIEPGRVSGIHGWGIGYVGGREFIRLDLLASVGREDYDEVVLEGEPTMRWRSVLGTPGDIATASIVLNVIPRMMQAPPGLLTMKDIMTPSAFLGDYECQT